LTEIRAITKVPRSQKEWSRHDYKQVIDKMIINDIVVIDVQNELEMAAYKLRLMGVCGCMWVYYVQARGN